MPRATPQISTDTATHLFELYDHVKAIFDYFPTLSIFVNQSGPLQSAGIYKAVANALYEHIVPLFPIWTTEVFPTPYIRIILLFCHYTLQLKEKLGAPPPNTITPLIPPDALVRYWIEIWGIEPLGYEDSCPRLVEVMATVNVQSYLKGIQLRKLACLDDGFGLIPPVIPSPKRKDSAGLADKTAPSDSELPIAGPSKTSSRLSKTKASGVDQVAEPPADNGSRKGSKRAPKPKVEAKSDPAGRTRAANPKPKEPSSSKATKAPAAASSSKSKKEAKSKAKGTKETSSAKASTSKASVESPPPRKGSKAKDKATPRSDTVTIRAEPASTTADESKPRPRPQIIKKSVVVEVPSLPDPEEVKSSATVQTGAKRKRLVGPSSKISQNVEEVETDELNQSQDEAPPTKKRLVSKRERDEQETWAPPPPITKSKGKGKAKAVSEDEVSDHHESNDEESSEDEGTDNLVPISKLDLKSIIGGTTKGNGPQERDEHNTALYRQLGRQNMIKYLRKNDMRLSVDEGSTYSSLDKVFVASTTIPLASAGLPQRPCTRCEHLNLPCQIPGLRRICGSCSSVQAKCSHNLWWHEYIEGLNRSFVDGLMSPIGLIYQSSHILDLMEENSSLDHQISLMQRRRHQNEEAIGNLQGLLKASVNNDPRIFLKTLFQEHPGFIANESQLHKLATACGWLLADFEPLEEVQTFLARPSDIPLHTATLNDVEVRMEGLDENISGLPTEMLASFDEAEPQDPSSLVVSNDDNAPLVSTSSGDDNMAIDDTTAPEPSTSKVDEVAEPSKASTPPAE
ncbi:hypothetical protein VNI00_008670 [Paramarasmius palmivorus]|uniref:Uncharacterized protein n=1 Tax=Paramarasmius palmivorus TaxID=297713 RepID=A0AAW0CWM7_9AGAR